MLIITIILLNISISTDKKQTNKINILDSTSSLRCSECSDVEPMDNLDIQPIEINKKDHPHCNMEENTYYVKKINAIDLNVIVKGGETIFYFVASTNRKFVLEDMGDVKNHEQANPLTLGPSPEHVSAPWGISNTRFRKYVLENMF